MTVRKRGKRGQKLIQDINLTPERSRPRLTKGGRAGVLFSLRTIQSKSSIRSRRNRRVGHRGRAVFATALNQRVVVKARVVKRDAETGAKRLRAHIRYLERSGTGLDGNRAQFYSQSGIKSKEEVTKSVRSWSDDQHYFRFIISPANAAELDLTSYCNRVLLEAEKHLGTKLEWFAINHFNTDNYHTHLIIRGVDERGKDLYLDKDFIKNGFRGIAEIEATKILGQRSEHEVSIEREALIVANRFTHIDKGLIEEAAEKGGVITLPRLSSKDSPYKHRLRHQKIGRLHHLRSLGLAEEGKGGQWRIVSDLEATLRSISKRNEIIKSVQKTLTADEDKGRGIQIYEDTDEIKNKITGVVLDKNLKDELGDDRFLTVRGDDGYIHYVPLGRYSEPVGFSSDIGSIVRFYTDTKKGQTDEIIARKAADNGGVFCVETVHEELRGRYEPLEAYEIASRFQGRCEGLERLGIIERAGETSWIIPSDLAEQIDAVESKIKKPTNKFRIETLSRNSIETQTRSLDVTWLDSKIDESLTKKVTPPWWIKDACEKRKEFLRSQPIQIRSGYANKMYMEERRLIIQKNLTKLGTYFENVSNETRGKIEGYVTIGASPHSIIRLENGWTLARVRRRENRLESGSEVFIFRGKRNELVTIPSRLGKEKRRKVGVQRG